MEEMQALNRMLYLDYLNEEEKALIDTLEEEFENRGANYTLAELWNYDSFLGGIGCYSMPADPKKNPFSGGYLRYLFRPLQYVRCSMEILDLNYTARDAIRDTGLYLEFVMKFLLKKRRGILSIVNNNGTLGKLSHKLYNLKSISDDQFECMKSIIKVYNKSKHEINSDVNRSMSFAPIDAVVFYLVARKVTMDLLMPYYDEIYQDFGDRLQYFHVNYGFIRGFGFVE